MKTRNIDWDITPDKQTGQCSFDQAQLAVLMDIREQLKILNAIIGCPNFTAIPQILRRISGNTAKPRPKK